MEVIYYMKNFINKFVFICLLFFCSFAIYSQSIDANIFKERRLKVINKIEDNSMAIFETAEVKKRNSDNNFQFKQDATFQYLTGLIEPKIYFILFKPSIIINNKEFNEIFFIQEKNPMVALYDGDSYNENEIKIISQADTILSQKLFQEVLKSELARRKYLYIGNNDYSLKKDVITGVSYNYFENRKDKLRSDYPHIEIKSLSDIINNMREVKSDDEIENINRAIQATSIGLIEAMKSCEPEMYEYELAAIIEYAFKKMGCEYYGFSSIIASGPNTSILHYVKNNRKMKLGDMVIMDVGAEFNGYSADITRTIPVNGKFTKEQKEIYSIVLRANEECIKIMLPGVKSQEIEAKAYDIIATGLQELGIIKEKRETKTYLPHGVSHNMGLDVHDVSTRNPLREGQILTIEPGIYIPQSSKGVPEKYLGIGVRIEDDVLITKSGNTVLSRDVPKSIEMIEKIMLAKGLGNQEIGKYKR
jgi:Xaa-Pro aminopeptidase